MPRKVKLDPNNPLYGTAEQNAVKLSAKNVIAREKRKKWNEYQNLYSRKRRIKKNEIQRIEHMAKSNARIAKAMKVSKIINYDPSVDRIITPDIMEANTPTLHDALIKQEVIFEPHPGPQTDFFAASEREVFYGGARGGGKSFAMIIDPLRYCDFRDARALVLRKTMPELRELIFHTKNLYKRAFPKATWREQEKEWVFPSGARIEFGYAENVDDALRYQGQAYTWIGVDELPQYPDDKIWNILRGSLRSANQNIPLFMRATGNPGNIGSHWVKKMFIEPAPANTPFKIEIKTDRGIFYVTRRFIPARLTDNPTLMANGDYYAMLASQPEVIRKQWLEGNWDAFDNAAFPEFDKKIHTVEPFAIPKSWIKFRAADWGYSSPACVLWFAIDYDNNLWVYRELYTKNLTADVFAMKVKTLESNDVNLKYGVMDASVWQKRGDVGPSIVEIMNKYTLRWTPSDRSPNSRKNGKMEIHRRFRQDPFYKDQPKIKIFASCTNLIRTLPTLPLDKNDIEDVDTDAEDHAYDALRYGCMSRQLGPRFDQMLISRMQKQKPVNADSKFGY